MRPIGFSTGALACGDFRRALRMLEGKGSIVLEVSALREPELDPLVDALDELTLEDRFEYISFHVPSRIDPTNEERVVGRLEPVARRGWPLIVHPGVIQTPELWERFNDLLCIENMDRRSATARSCEELEPHFDRFPRASFCVDLGHAWQVDPSMGEAYRMLSRFSPRLRQVHLSEVTFESRHARISLTAKFDFQSIAALVPAETPIVLESVLDDASQIDRELRVAEEALTPKQAPRIADCCARPVPAEPRRALKRSDPVWPNGTVDSVSSRPARH